MAAAHEAAGGGAVESEAAADTGGGSCAEVMTAEALAGRGFGFDGTVLSVVPAAETDEDAGAMPAYAVAQFEVHEWFAGGDRRNPVGWRRAR